MQVNISDQTNNLNSSSPTPNLLSQFQSGEYRRRFLWHGFSVFALGCIAPLFIPFYTNPRGGLSAHTLGIMSGLLSMAVGMAIPYGCFTQLRAKLLFWFFVPSSYAGLIIQVFAAIFGLTQSFTVTAKGYPGGVLWMEILATVGLRTVSVFILLGAFIMMSGLSKAKGNTSSGVQTSQSSSVTE